MIPCLIYAILRIFYDNSMCWAEPSSDAYVEWIYMSLGLACIIANSFFFFNIFRILVTKLQAPHANEPAHFRYVFFRLQISRLQSKLVIVKLVGHNKIELNKQIGRGSPNFFVNQTLFTFFLMSGSCHI